MTKTTRFGTPVSQNTYPSMTKQPGLVPGYTQSTYPSLTKTTRFGTRVYSEHLHELTITTRFVPRVYPEYIPEFDQNNPAWYPGIPRVLTRVWPKQPGLVPGHIARVYYTLPVTRYTLEYCTYVRTYEHRRRIGHQSTAGRGLAEDVELFQRHTPGARTLVVPLRDRCSCLGSAQEDAR